MGIDVVAKIYVQKVPREAILAPRLYNYPPKLERLAR